MLKEPRSLLFFKGAVYQFTFNEDGKFTQSQLCMLIQLPSQDVIDSFMKIRLMVAPTGVKFIEYDDQKRMSEYIEEGWVEHLVGIAPERSHCVGNNMRGQRRQYGLKHHVTSTVHACMGDTLKKIVTEISNEKNEFNLWDKAQAVVLLSRTRLGSDIIFVGDKHNTINSLASLIKTKSQWMNYMEKVLEVTVDNGIDESGQISVFSNEVFPYRLYDITLPTCNTGFVYMLISTKNHNFCYIGETENISRRLHEHNSGYKRSTLSTPKSYRPYALFAYICGFNRNRNVRRYIEFEWKKKIAEERERGVICFKQYARCVSCIISRISYDVFQIDQSELRLITNFDE